MYNKDHFPKENIQHNQKIPSYTLLMWLHTTSIVLYSVAGHTMVLFH